MGLFNFRKSPQSVSAERVKDFFRYCEAANCTGQSSGRGGFGDAYYVECIWENQKRVYTSILFSSARKWAHISIENGTVKYQYTENGDLRCIGDCPVTMDQKEIRRTAKAFLRWYKRLKLPESIGEVQTQMEAVPAVSIVKEIEVDAFGEVAVLRVLSDQHTFLIFNSFPPEKGNLTQQQADHFETLLEDAIQKKVIHDDRELFLIFDDSQQMIEDVVVFLRGFE